jgi:prolycopene isomerase
MTAEDGSDSRVPRNDAYDVVVVGSGLGGVTAAATLAKAGLKVLVVEQQDVPGGYARALRRGPYTFDSAIHVSAQGKDGDLYDAVLKHLGVREHCRFLLSDDFYGAVFPDRSFTVPQGLDAYIERHAREFPEEAPAIREFVELCLRTHRESHELPMQLSLRGLDDAVQRLPSFFKYRRATLTNVLDEYLHDERLKSLFGAPWPYIGLPPSQLAFLTYAQMVAIMMGSSWFPEGSFQRLVDAIVLGLERHGGQLQVNRDVRRIVVDDGKVAGVELEDGTRIGASVVISNADARHTFDDLVGHEHLPPQFVRRLHRMEPSLSACVVFAATTIDVSEHLEAPEMFVFSDWDHDRVFTDVLAGKVASATWLAIPTLLDPSLAPQGEHLVILSALVPYDGIDWNREKERVTEELLDVIERSVPGFRERTTFVESATPIALERNSRNFKGALYGWANTPEQTGTKRLPHETPIGGLYLSGHWTMPGGTSFRVFASGVHTAQLVARDFGAQDAIPSFAEANLPPLM